MISNYIDSDLHLTRIILAFFIIHTNNLHTCLVPNFFIIDTLRSFLYYVTTLI